MIKVIYEIYKKQGDRRERVAIVSNATKAIKYIKEHLPSDNSTMAMSRDFFRIAFTLPILMMF